MDVRVLMIFAQESNFGVDAAKNRRFFFGVNFPPNAGNQWRRHMRAILCNFGLKIFKIEALRAVQKSENFEKLHKIRRIFNKNASKWILKLESHLQRPSEKVTNA